MPAQLELFNPHCRNICQEVLWTFRNPSPTFPIEVSKSWIAERLNNFVRLNWSSDMPRTSKRRNTLSGMPEFVDCALSRDDKTNFGNWASKNKDNFEDTLLDYVGMGIKVTFSFDARNDAYICSFTPKFEEDPNTGLCLTSRAPEPYTAFLVNRFKHEMIFEGGKWESIAGDNDIR